LPARRRQADQPALDPARPGALARPDRGPPAGAARIVRAWHSEPSDQPAHPPGAPASRRPGVGLPPRRSHMARRPSRPTPGRPQARAPGPTLALAVVFTLLAAACAGPFAVAPPTPVPATATPAPTATPS